MKILLLSAPNSPHTIKWATSLAKQGLEIIVFGFTDNLQQSAYANYPNIKVVTNNQKVSRKGSLVKLHYLKALPAVRKLIKELKPDVVHAHYATSYGLLGALSGFKPYIVSLWGSDIFIFPKKSYLHKAMLKFNLSRACKVLSTSQTMAEEASLYTHKPIEVTPFGVDLQQFSPRQTTRLFAPNDIVIGTIKALEPIYGVEYLIQAFKLISDKYPNLPLKLLLVGSGSLETELKALVAGLLLNDKTVFTGYVPHQDIPLYQNMLSVFVALSISESFGVAVLEASACAKPVVVSNVGGLPEIVEDEVTGIIVPPRDIQATAVAIERLILDPQLTTRMGNAARERVKRLYSWDNNVNQMIKIYEDLINESGNNFRRSSSIY